MLEQPSLDKHKVSRASHAIAKLVTSIVLMLTFTQSFAQLLDQTPERESEVRQLVRDYFSAKDRGDYRNAYTFLSPSDQQQVPYETWVPMVKRFNQQAGPVIARTIVGITWYRNPPNVAPGLYCTVDFVGSFKNIDKLSGYLALQLDEKGNFLIVREEQNYVDKKVDLHPPATF